MSTSEEVQLLKEEVTDLKTEIIKIKELIHSQVSEKLYTVAQVATSLNLTPAGVNFHIRKGHIKAIGKRCKKIRESELNNYILTIKKQE